MTNCAKSYPAVIGIGGTVDSDQRRVSKYLAVDINQGLTKRDLAWKVIDVFYTVYPRHYHLALALLLSFFKSTDQGAASTNTLLIFLNVPCNFPNASSPMGKDNGGLINTNDQLIQHLCKLVRITIRQQPL